MKAAAILLALLVGAISATPIHAQSSPVGIGFAQAEEGTWWCHAGDPEQALTCALDKCKAGSGGQECHPTRWCSPAGWSGLMTVWLPEFHNTIPLCGTSGEAALVGAFKALCDGSPDFTRCDLVTIIDPGGNERQIDDVNWPGPAISDTEPPTADGREQGIEPQ